MINLSMAEPDNILRPRLSVVGVGGAGGNAINNMIRSTLEGCDFIVANTDSQALAQSLAPRKLQLGVNLSRGLGAGSKPEIGRAAAEEQIEEIMAMLDGSDMLFVTAGMGGGTGTGAAPVIARAAREAGILTVGVVTKPFNFEGRNRMKMAEMGIEEMQRYVDTLIVIPNQNLFRIATERTSVAEAFRMADEVLYSGVRGITDLMVMPGFMNLDFADVKTVMGEMGKAMLGTGEAEGENRAIRAAEIAISNPLLDDISMKGARGVLINITGSFDMTLFEMDEAANRIRDEVDPEAQIKVGSTLDETLNGRIRVSVIATGIDAAIAEQERKRLAAQNTPQNLRTAPPAAMMQQAAPAPVVKPAPVAKEPTTVTSTVSLSANYFTMPQPATVQTVMPEPVASLEEMAAETEMDETPMMAEEAKMEPAMQEAEVHPHPTFRQAPPRPAAPAQTTSPLRATTTAAATRAAAASTPAPQPARQVEPENVRVTQIATPATATSAGTTNRSQSLFKRITGFGMVRPSQEDDLDDVKPQMARASIENDASDKGLSSETGDLLDIPAFLRRQTNH